MIALFIDSAGRPLVHVDIASHCTPGSRILLMIWDKIQVAQSFVINVSGVLKPVLSDEGMVVGI